MSKDSSNSKIAAKAAQPVKPWPYGPLKALLLAIVIFIASQLITVLLLSFYPAIRHMDSSQASSWLDTSIPGQFFFVLIFESLVVWGIYILLKRRGLHLSSIGLKKPRLADPVYGLAAAPVFVVLYLIIVSLVKDAVPGFNLNQQQQVGFNGAAGSLQLILAFISLVILPPIAEEILFRGFIYTSLKKAMKILPAALITSLLFGAGHLTEGGAAGPLWIGALTTFILSLVLVYLREKTGRLYASMTLHALNNAIAFVSLFVAHAR